MRKLNRLLMAALVLTVPLAACDEGDSTITPEPTPPAVGTVSGTVTVQGEGGLAGITVQLAGASAASTTTGSDGSFSFANVVEGNYSVAISGIPAAFTFQNTTQSVSINTNGQTASVSFSGQVVRTASISGSVSAGGTAVGGVAVSISGPDGNETKQTGNTGTFQFTGLRNGNYTVSITNPDPALYTFNNTQANVALGVGESEVVEFSGQRTGSSDPATVAIERIINPATGNPLAATGLAGTILVEVAIDEGAQDVTQLDVMLGGQTICTQTFTAPVSGEPAQVGEVFEIDCTVNTAAFNATTGTPTFLNGATTIQAMITTASGDTENATINATLANADAFIATTTATNTAMDGTGRVWVGNGSYTTTVLPVMYSGRGVGSISAAWVPGANSTATNVAIGAPTPAGTITDNTAPYTFTWTNPGYQTDSDPGDEDRIRVTYATYSNGDPVNAGAGFPTTVASNVRWDEVAPTPGVLVMQGRPNASGNACCTNNWAFATYAFSSGHTGATDGTGVGIGTGGILYQTGATFGTNITVAGDMGTSAVNTAYNLRARVADRLGNFAVTPLVANAQNPLTTWGHDNAIPTSEAFAAGSEANQTVYNIANPAPANLAYNFSAVDNVAGFGADPVDTRATRQNATTTTCLIGTVPVGGGCNANAQPLAQLVPVAADGLYSISGLIRDQAGNPAATTLSRQSYRDQTAPFVSNIVLPTNNPLPGGTVLPFSAVVGDALGVGTTSMALVYAGAGETLPFSAPQQFSTAFDGNFITSQQVAENIAFVESLEVLAGGNDMNANLGAQNPATAAQFLVLDAAGNASSANNPFAAGTVVPNGTIAGRLPVGVVNFQITTPAAATNLCNGAGTTCPSPANTSSVLLTATVTGPSGVLNNPFAQLHFMFDDLSGTPQARTRLIGTAGSPTVTDTGALRTWTWTFTWNPQGDVQALPSNAPVEIFAVGVESNGNAVKTQENANITIVVGS